jgi:hypothetical protein
MLHVNCTVASHAYNFNEQGFLAVHMHMSIQHFFASLRIV